MSHALFDAVKKEKGIAQDAQLSALLGFSRPQINRYRHGHDPISPSVILRIYDFAGFSIERIRELAADKDTPQIVKVKAPKPAKPAKVSRPWHAVVSQHSEVAASAASAPVVAAAPSRATPSSVIVTKTPKWVSRVHRFM